MSSRERNFPPKQVVQIILKESELNPKQKAISSPLMHEEEIGRRLVPVIVGGDILAYSYVREFHRHYGIKRCIVIMTKNVKMISASRFTDCYLAPHAGEPEGLYAALETVANNLRRENPRLVPLVLGCDDRHALMFSAGRERLEAAGLIVPCNDTALLERISRKRGFYDICDELDIPHPRTWYYDASAEGPRELPLDDFPYPCIAKPSSSAAFQNANIPRKRKVYEVNSPDELAQIWQEVRSSDYDGEFLIQDFVPGDDSALRILNTFSDPSGQLRIAAGGIVVLQDHSPLALGNPVCIVGQKDDSLIASAKKFLNHVGYEGYGNFDIKYDARTKRHLFLEINARAGRSSYLTSLAGVNFVTLAVDQYILGRDIPYQEAYAPFAYCCVPPYVLKRSVADKQLLNRALSLLASTEDADPLCYARDTVSHNSWATAMSLNHIRKFNRYLWSAPKLQFE